MFRNAAAKMAEYKGKKAKEKLASRLWSAAHSGDLDTVLQILRDTNHDLEIINYIGHVNGDVRRVFKNADGTTCEVHSGNAVNAAATSGQLATLKALLEVPGIGINYRGSGHLYTPLAAAIVYGRKDAALELAARPDLDPNLDDLVGVAPIIYAIGFCPLVIPALIAHPGLDPNVTDAANKTALHILCNRRPDDEFLDECIQLLVDHPAIKIDARDDKMYTPLMYAAASGNTAACSSLLAAGANKTLLNAVDCTAERLAELNGYKELARMIREYDYGCDAEKEQSMVGRFKM